MGLNALLQPFEWHKISQKEEHPYRETSTSWKAGPTCITWSSTRLNVKSYNYNNPKEQHKMESLPYNHCQEGPGVVVESKMNLSQWYVPQQQERQIISWAATSSIYWTDQGKWLLSFTWHFLGNTSHLKTGKGKLEIVPQRAPSLSGGCKTGQMKKCWRVPLLEYSRLVLSEPLIT